MHKLTLCLVSASLLTAAAQAAPYEYAEARTGAFVGGRFQVPLGVRKLSKPRASLAIAPVVRRFSSTGEIRSAIGEGAALNFGSRPSLTLVGARADRLVGLQPSQDMDATQKLGISKGGWIAIGVGAALVGAALYGYSVYDEARDNSE